MTAADTQNGLSNITEAADQVDFITVKAVIDFNTGCIFLTIKNGVDITAAGDQKGITCICQG